MIVEKADNGYTIKRVIERLDVNGAACQIPEIVGTYTLAQINERIKNINGGIEALRVEKDSYIQMRDAIKLTTA